MRTFLIKELTPKDSKFQLNPLQHNNLVTIHHTLLSFFRTSPPIYLASSHSLSLSRSLSLSCSITHTLSLSLSQLMRRVVNKNAVGQHNL